MSKISVILPTYNEKNNIGKLINSILKIIKQPLEIIVVDDNSPDKTWKIVEKIKKKNNNVKLLRRMDKKGLASALYDGISLSRGNIIVWMDCDFSHPPELIPKLIDSMDSYDIIIASRYVKNGGDERSFIRVLTSRAINLFANVFLTSGIKDYTTGFVATKRNALNKIKFSPRGYGEYCIEFLYESYKNGLKIKEIPYTFYSRKFGKTKTISNIFQLLRHGIIYSLTIFRLKFNDYIRF